MYSVVHVITSLEAAGAQTALKRVIEHKEASFKSTVISLKDEGSIGKELMQHGVPVHVIGMRQGLAAPLVVAKLARILKRLRPDIVHTWLYHADLLGGIAARLAGVKRVAWAIRNGSLSASETSWSTHAVVRMCAMLSSQIPDAILCCSERARQTHLALGYDRTKFVVVPNGYDLQHFVPNKHFRSEVRQELGIAQGAPIVGLIARFHPQKSHKTFIQAAAILKRRHPHVHFLLAGADVDKDNKIIEGWIHEGAMQHFTHLLGLRKDIARLTAALDIATLCSSFGEAFPNVVGEAMACGIPCVVTDVGDAADIVGETGKVVPPEHPEALAQAWSQLLEMSPAERRNLGDQARERIAARFEISAVVRRYNAFYDALQGAAY
jgi:glycosyltransferase involved in cell wall biosynthesis